MIYRHIESELFKICYRLQQIPLHVLKKVPLEELIATLTKPVQVVLRRDLIIKAETPKKEGSAPKTKTQNKNKQLVKHHIFIEGEICWARMRGFPLWPAKVTISIHSHQ